MHIHREVRVAPWWPEDVAPWAEAALSDPALKDEHAAALRALVGVEGESRRLQFVGTTLRKLWDPSKDPQRCLGLLERAWRWPHYLQRAEEQNIDPFSVVQQIAKSCKRTAELLHTHASVPVRWLAIQDALKRGHSSWIQIFPPEDPQFYRAAEATVAKLVEDLRSIALGTAYELIFPDQDFPPLPVVRRLPGHQETFFIRLLLQFAVQQYKEPLIAEIAALGVVRFGKDKDADWVDRVKENYRDADQAIHFHVPM